MSEGSGNMTAVNFPKRLVKMLDYISSAGSSHMSHPGRSLSSYLPQGRSQIRAGASFL